MNVYRIKNLLWWVAIVYSGTLLYIVFFARRRRGRVLFAQRDWNIVPLLEKWKTIASWEYISNEERYAFIENALGNIILFMPLPFFLFFLLGVRQFKQHVLIAIGLSMTIELLQYITSVGIADVDDIVLNTIGVAIGFVITAWIARRVVNFKVG